MALAIRNGFSATNIRVDITDPNLHVQAVITGTVSLTATKDLSTNKNVKIAIDAGSAALSADVDISGATDSATTKTEIVAALNAASNTEASTTGVTYWSLTSGTNYLVCTSAFAGAGGFVQIADGGSVSATTTVFGTATSATGTNGIRSARLSMNYPGGSIGGTNVVNPVMRITNTHASLAITDIDITDGTNAVSIIDSSSSDAFVLGAVTQLTTLAHDATNFLSYTLAALTAADSVYFVIQSSTAGAHATVDLEF